MQQLIDLRHETPEAISLQAIGSFMQAGRPAIVLFSGGKDSVVLLHLAVKAFWPAPIPFPVLHIDTGHNFPEVLAFRDRTVEQLGYATLAEMRTLLGGAPVAAAEWQKSVIAEATR